MVRLLVHIFNLTASLGPFSVKYNFCFVSDIVMNRHNPKAEVDSKKFYFVPVKVNFHKSAYKEANPNQLTWG